MCNPNALRAFLGDGYSAVVFRSCKWNRVPWILWSIGAYGEALNYSDIAMCIRFMHTVLELSSIHKVRAESMVVPALGRAM